MYENDNESQSTSFPRFHMETHTHTSPHAKASVVTPDLTQECSFFVSYIARAWSFSKSEK